MPLTIVSVNSADAGGGAERVARDLHGQYAAAGEDAWLAVGRKGGTDSRTVQLPNRERRSAWARAWMAAADWFPRHGAGFHVGRALRGAVAEPGRWRAARQGAEDFDHPGTDAILTLAGRVPDALHLHNLHGGYFDLRRLPELSARVPTVLSFHDAWLLSGHCAHSLGCERWATGCGECPALWTYPAIPRDNTAANWARKRDIYARSALHVGVPCEWLAAKIRRSALMPGVRSLRVIPWGVDVDVFRPADRAASRVSLGLDPGRALFLTHENSLRDLTWKDAHAFRAALSRMGTRGAAAQWVALGVAGEDVEVHGVRFRRAALEADDRRLARWYQAADAYVHPARADTFPLMVLEAQACGTPVIATDVGGIGEQVERYGRSGEATGFVVRPGSGMAIAEAVETLLALDPGARSAMGAAAATRARAHFDRSRSARTYHEWIRELAAGRRTDAR